MTKKPKRKRERAALAARWYAAMRSARPGRGLERKFQAWLDADPANEVDFGRCELAVELARETRDDPALAPYLTECADLAARHRRHATAGGMIGRNGFLPRPAMMAGAFGVLAAAVLAGWFWNPPAAHETVVGEQRVVTLSDGTSVTLNTDTRISVDYTRRARRVELTRGEAYFSVRPNPARPFEVFASKGVIRALGTAFNVALRDSEVRVVVLEGSVEVQPNSGGGAVTAAGPRPPRLTVGESVTFWESGAIAPVVKADTRPILAWREGRLEFNSLRLEHAIGEHNRYATSRIVIGSEELKSLAVNGIFRVGDTDSFLFLLENSLGLRAVRQADAIVLLTGPRSTVGEGQTLASAPGQPATGARMEDRRESQAPDPGRDAFQGTGEAVRPARQGGEGD